MRFEMKSFLHVWNGGRHGKDKMNNFMAKCMKCSRRPTLMHWKHWESERQWKAWDVLLYGTNLLEKVFFSVALPTVWLVWKWVSKKRLKSSCKHQMNGPNGAQRAQHRTLKLSERLTETRMQNCLYLRVSMCVWYHYSGWIAYAYAQILISLWWMCARFYGFIRKRYYSMAFARVYRTKRVHTHAHKRCHQRELSCFFSLSHFISHSVLHVRTPSVKMFQLNFEAFVCGKAYTRRTEHNANWLSMCATVLS